MKENGGRAMRTMGSLKLSRSLMEGEVVDRFGVVVLPALTGSTDRERSYDVPPQR